MAKSAKAKILGFRVKTNSIAAILAKKEGIKIVNFEIIYELVQSLRQLMEKVLKAEIVRKDMGKMKTLLVFRTEKKRQIVGGKITEGEVKKGFLIEVFRDEEKVGKGKVINLQKNKKNIEVATKGDEAGILYEGDIKVEEKDIIVFYIKEKTKAEL